MRVNGLIIGAGIIGSAVAYELSRRGVNGLHVVDPDLEGTWSSSERNAGGVRHLWQHRINVELSRATISLCDRLGDEVGFQRTGYLWMYPPSAAEEGRRIQKLTREHGVEYHELSFAEIRARYPFIDKEDDLAFGVFGPRDGLINSNALKNYFRREAKAKGVSFHDRRWVERVEETNGRAQAVLVSVPSGDSAEQRLKDPTAPRTGVMENWEADFIVLCAGAWTQPLLARLVSKTHIQPVRRQMCLFKAEGLDLTPYGMVVDTSRVYFHPEGGNILAGFVVKDEAPGFHLDYDPAFFENHIWPALFARSSKMERMKALSGWAGLYSYTPDVSGILGALPGYQKLYEAHSFTGRGVMQSYGAAIAIADLIVDKKFREIEAAALSRSRFDGPKSGWLPEGLHI